MLGKSEIDKKINNEPTRGEAKINQEKLILYYQHKFRNPSLKEQTDIKSEAVEQWGNKFHGFKKKGGGRNKARKQQTAADDFFRVVGFPKVEMVQNCT